jgi:hypothetical protein
VVPCIPFFIANVSLSMPLAVIVDTNSCTKSNKTSIDSGDGLGMSPCEGDRRSSEDVLI